VWVPLIDEDDLSARQARSLSMNVNRRIYQWPLRMGNPHIAKITLLKERGFLRLFSASGTLIDTCRSIEVRKRESTKLITIF
jgi:hypothetical protein